MTDNPKITIYLKDFLDSHLGRREDGSHMWYCRPVDDNIASVIEHLTGNKHTCYIEHFDSTSEVVERPLDSLPLPGKPILWEYSAWVSHSVRWQLSQQRSNKERIQRFIFEQNVKIIAKKFMEFCCVDNLEVAKATAYSMLKNGMYGNIRALGVKKLITKEEELV